jgi:signal transduction histidine kinase/DNA-binding NarL/FixJ family response regulator
MNREVLLIDDEKPFRTALMQKLPGYTFIEAISPAHGKKAINANPQVRVVLLDLDYKGVGDATSVIEYVKDGRDYRFIVLTAHQEMLGADAAGEHAVFRYLSKDEKFETIKFALDQAFKDLERQHLVAKMGYHLDIQDRIGSNKGLAEILDLICEGVQEIVDAYTCHIRIYDFARGDFPLGGFAGPKTLREVLDQPKVSGALFSGRVISTGEEEVIDDLQAMPQFREFAKRSRESRRQIPEPEQQYWQTVRSCYLVPIRTGVLGRRVDAVLNVSSDKLAFFTDEKQALVKEFVTQASLAMAKRWLEQKRSEIHEDHNEIGKMFNDMSELDSIGRIFDVVTSGIAKLINAEVVSIFLFDEEDGVLKNKASYSGSDYVIAADRATEVYKPGESFTGTVYLKDDTIMRPDPREEKQVKPTDDPLHEYEQLRVHVKGIPYGKLEHYLGVPLRVRGKKRGVLRAMNKKSAYYDTNRARTGDPRVLLERGFSVDCLNALTITAGHLAVTIRNAELLEKRDERVRQVETLVAVGKIINQTLEMNEVLALTIEQMAKVMRARIGMLFLKDDHDPNRVVLKASYGMPVIDASYKKGDGVTGRCYESNRPTLISVGKLNCGRYNDEIREHLQSTDSTPPEIESLMVVPIIVKGTTLGVMKVVNRQERHVPFTDEDLELFEMFAELVAVAIDNAQIYKAANENAVLSLMVSVAAHEIGNTSGVIPANVAAIRDALGTQPPEIENMLATIEASATEATDFAKEISGFSPTRPDQKEDLDLNELFDSTVHAFQYDLQRYKQSAKSVLKVNPSNEPLVCRIFRRPFEQTIRNIIINAFQALGDKDDGYVRVSMTAEESDGGKFAAISIEDNGCGIDPKDITRIFDGGFTRKPRGSGVGLWLAQKHLALLGGTIAVESELNRGSKFTVRLPRIVGEEGT